jgi:hypothetical protein
MTDVDNRISFYQKHLQTGIVETPELYGGVKNYGIVWTRITSTYPFAVPLTNSCTFLFWVFWFAELQLCRFDGVWTAWLDLLDGGRGWPARRRSYWGVGYHIDYDNLSRFVKESRIIKSTD